MQFISRKEKNKKIQKQTQKYKYKYAEDVKIVNLQNAIEN